MQKALYTSNIYCDKSDNVDDKMKIVENCDTCRET